jgi:hypothetical protein
MGILKFERRFFEHPTEPHHLPVDKILRDYKSTKEVGAQILLMVIDRINRIGFSFPTPEPILYFAKDFFPQRDVLQEF